MKKQLIFIFLLTIFCKQGIAQNKLADSLLNVLAIEKEDTNKVNTLYKIAGLYLSGNEKSKAIECFEKGLQLSKKIGFDLGQIRYYISLGKMYNTAPKNIQKSIELFKSGLDLSQEIKSSNYTANFAGGLSSFYNSQGNYPESIKYRYIAIKENENIKDTSQLIHDYNFIGSLLLGQNNFKESIKYHNFALSIREKKNQKNLIGQSLVNLGETYLTMGSLDSSYIYISRAIDLYKDLGDKAFNWGLPLSYGTLAKMYLVKGQVAAQKNEQTKAKSNYDEALINYLKSQNLYRKDVSKITGDKLDIDIGVTYFKLNNIVLADSFLNSGLNHLQKDSLANINYQDDKSKCYLFLSKIDSIKGDWKESRANYLQFITIRDFLFNEENTKKATAYQMQYEFDLKEAAEKAKQEKKELASQKEAELKVLNYEYEKKQTAAKSEREKQQLQYEQQLRQQEIEAAYVRKTAEIEAEQQRKEAIAKVEQDKKDALNASALALSQAEVKRKNQERNYFLIGFGLMTALLGFIVFGYFQKQKANSLLQHQKDEINQKSHQLEKSLSDLKSTQAQLIQSEKMASLGELTAGIAHEIQNPLNFVNNFSEVSVDLAKELKEEAEKPEIDKDLIIDLATDLSQNQEKINHHGKRASDIVKGMLEHSRTSTGQKEATDINALADEYLRLAYHGLRAKDKSFNATMETHFDPNLPKIDIIPQDIGRVILNLITNAFYAVNERSKKGEAGYEPKVTVTTQLTANNQLQITIKDNGSGIPEHIKDKIFQPFFTTKPTGQGTGLGLSLSYDIVKAHGGELNVETKEGEGSDFFFYFAYLN